MTSSKETLTPVLLVQAATRLCALPLASVVEIMRPLPLRAFAGAPEFVSGMAVVRGASVPVVDLCCLLGSERAEGQRWIALEYQGASAVLWADRVLGVRALDTSRLTRAPRLLGEANSRVQLLGNLDGELLVLLDTGRLLPAGAWPEAEPKT
ncbi:MAG TPA: chemotaxis protein CheW [Polyangiaceae bacterium]|nr:chemotaxis protein CheW [Polyangiaceae bacterium]